MLVLAGDHIYKMDYGPMLASHVEKRADITVGVVEVPREQATAFGVMSVDPDYRITKFSEKPKEPEGIPGREQFALGSMGIYVFKANLLYRLLEEEAKRPDTNARFRPQHHSRGARLAEGVRLSVHRHATRASSTTGATSAPSTPSTRRTWSWCTSTPS